MKEPVFFSDETAWNRGTDWYRSLFAESAPGSLTGEASVEYTDPAVADTAAARIAATIPDARLVCLLRDPIDRLRSHYRHEVQRGLGVARGDEVDHPEREVDRRGDQQQDDEGEDRDDGRVGPGARHGRTIPVGRGVGIQVE